MSQLHCEERGGKGRACCRDGDVTTTAIFSERVCSGSECSSHGVREQGYLVWWEGGRTAGGGGKGKTGYDVEEGVSEGYMLTCSSRRGGEGEGGIGSSIPRRHYCILLASGMC